MSLGILTFLCQGGRGNVGKQGLHNQVVGTVGSLLVVAFLGALVLVILLALAINLIALKDILHNAVAHTSYARFSR